VLEERRPQHHASCAAPCAGASLPDPEVAVPLIGVIVFPGTSIQDNLAEKDRKLGIPVWRFGGA